MNRRTILIIVLVGTGVLAVEAALLWRVIAPGEGTEEPVPDTVRGAVPIPAPGTGAMEAPVRTPTELGLRLREARAALAEIPATTPPGPEAIRVHREIARLALERGQEHLRLAARMRRAAEECGRERITSHISRVGGESSRGREAVVLEMEISTEDELLLAGAEDEERAAAARLDEAKEHLRLLIAHSVAPAEVEAAHALLGDIHAYREEWEDAASHYLEAGDALLEDRTDWSEIPPRRG